VKELDLHDFVELSGSADRQELLGKSDAEGVCASFASLGSMRNELMWLWVRSTKMWRRTCGKVFWNGGKPPWCSLKPALSLLWSLGLGCWLRSTPGRRAGLNWRFYFNLTSPELTRARKLRVPGGAFSVPSATWADCGAAAGVLLVCLLCREREEELL